MTRSVKKTAASVYKFRHPRATRKGHKQRVFFFYNKEQFYVVAHFERFVASKACNSFKSAFAIDNRGRF